MSRPFSIIKTAKVVWSSTIFEDLKKSEEKAKGFIQDNDLPRRWQHLASCSSFVIGDEVFGAGCNFLTSWLYWCRHAPADATLFYLSNEKNPYTVSDLRCLLNACPKLKIQAKALLEQYPVLTPGFHLLTFENGRIQLLLMIGDFSDNLSQLLICGDERLEKVLRTKFVDAWFINSPVLPPAIALLSDTATTLSNHRQDQDLRERQKSLPKRKTAWQFSSTPCCAPKQATVLGAGLAGCFTAYFLACRGWKITLVDAESVAAGASGIQQAVLYPILSAFNSPLSDFMLSAYLYAHNFYKTLLKSHPIGKLSGSLLAACTPKEAQTQLAMRQWLEAYPQLGRLVSVEEATEYLGIHFANPGIYAPLSGWIDSRALCNILTKHPLIQTKLGYSIKQIHYEKGRWELDGQFCAPILIIANGYRSNQFLQTAELPLQPIAGQVSFVKTNEAIRDLKIPLCGTGHLLPAYHGQHLLGASYDPGLLADEQAQRENLQKLAELGLTIENSTDIIANWQSIRAVTPDYLPLVGPVPEPAVFMEDYKMLRTDANRWVAKAGAYYPGLYLCAGFGSRGLSSVPLSANWLASLVNNEFNFFSNRRQQSLSPARFLIKQIIKGR